MTKINKNDDVNNINTIIGNCIDNKLEWIETDGEQPRSINREKIINDIKEELRNQGVVDNNYEIKDCSILKNEISKRIKFWWHLRWKEAPMYRILWTFPGNYTLRYTQLLQSYRKDEFKFVDKNNNPIDIPIDACLFYCNTGKNNMREEFGTYIWRNNEEDKDLIKEIIDNINDINLSLKPYKIWEILDEKDEAYTDLWNELWNLYKQQLDYCETFKIWLSDRVHVCFCDPNSSTDKWKKSKDEWKKSKLKRIGIYHNNILELDENKKYAIIINSKSYDNNYKSWDIEWLYYNWDKERINEYEENKDYFIKITEILKTYAKKNDNNIKRINIDENNKISKKSFNYDDFENIFNYFKSISESLNEEENSKEKKLLDKINETKDDILEYINNKNKERNLYRYSKGKKIEYPDDFFQFNPDNWIKIIYTWSTSHSNCAQNKLVKDNYHQIFWENQS